MDEVLQSGGCPNPVCQDGQLQSPDDLKGLSWLNAESNRLEDVLRLSDDHELGFFTPVCVSCLGIDLLRRQVELRKQADNNTLLDITPALDWHAELSRAREQKGYSQLEFDDREWGFNFGDEDQEEYEDCGGEEDFGGQQVVREADGSIWQLPPVEAVDADAVNIITRSPATADAVEALLRRNLSEDELQTNGGIECGVCKEDMLESQKVAELPCSHFYHDQCIQDWLADHRTCPVCRYELPGADETQDSDNDGEDTSPNAEEDGHIIGGDSGAEDADAGEDSIHANDSYSPVVVSVMEVADGVAEIRRAEDDGISEGI